MLWGSLMSILQPASANPSCCCCCCLMCVCACSGAADMQDLHSSWEEYNELYSQLEETKEQVG